MKKFVLVVFCVVTTATLAVTSAAAEEWKLDPNHSKLKFAIDARMISAEGVFRTFSVKDDINEQALEKSTFEVTVDTSSIDTNSEQRDKHLKSDAFFDVAKFPTAQIVVSSLRKVGEGNYEGDASVTIHGITKQMKLPARILLNEGGILRFRGTVEINRKDFGVSFQSAMNKIEDIATVTYELNLRKPGGGRGGAAPPPPRP
jgi:polyisoprenoid-binding protein YceI